MAQVNDCYHIRTLNMLVSVTSIIPKPNNKENQYGIEILQKYITAKTGYTKDIFTTTASENFFRGRVLVDNTIFAKITKLLQINSVVCNNILKEASRSVTDYEHKMAFICNTWSGHVICYRNQCVGFSNNEVILFDGPMYILIYIPVEYFFKIKEQCERTIELINDIWPKKSS